ncbi:hypothetical protein COT47_04325, partial [Candidatus Woesearchaeota archaeon CG08_land_8_20_14_0_20_43_7]
MFYAPWYLLYFKKILSDIKEGFYILDINPLSSFIESYVYFSNSRYLLILYLPLIFYGLLKTKSKFRTENNTLLSYLIVSFIPFTISPMIPAKYIIFSYPAFIILVANGIAQFKRAYITAIVIFVVILLSGIELWGYVNYDDFDWKDLSEYLKPNIQEGDVIV